MSQQNSKSASIASNTRECLWILIFFGIVFLICRPSFMVKLRKNKQWEAREYISSLNKGQQAYFAKKSVFSTYVKALGIGIKIETKNYNYSILTTKTATFNYGVSKQKDLTSYVGGVFVIPATQVNSNASKNKITTTSILCEADSPGTIKPAEPTYQNGKLVCGTGTIEVTKKSH
ncbi:type IV pilin-like G/H family protein [Microcoleus sp. Pol7_A1]|uniref:type IV pilin-like G/H family protein n=1 Tax=Microcoleus sp. Pol7_A1 TaxID=2818893 RepID=UPI002FD58FA1